MATAISQLLQEFRGVAQDNERQKDQFNYQKDLIAFEYKKKEEMRRKEEEKRNQNLITNMGLGLVAGALTGGVASLFTGGGAAAGAGAAAAGGELLPGSIGATAAAGGGQAVSQGIAGAVGMAAQSYATPKIDVMQSIFQGAAKGAASGAQDGPVGLGLFTGGVAGIEAVNGLVDRAYKDRDMAQKFKLGEMGLQESSNRVRISELETGIRQKELDFLPEKQKMEREKNALEKWQTEQLVGVQKGQLSVQQTELAIKALTGVTDKTDLLSIYNSVPDQKNKRCRQEEACDVYL